MKASKLRFDGVTRKLDNGLDRRHAFVTLRCEKVESTQILFGSWNRMTPEWGNMSVLWSCADILRWIIHGDLIWFMVCIIMTCVTS